MNKYDISAYEKTNVCLLDYVPGFETGNGGGGAFLDIVLEMNFRIQQSSII